MKLSENPSNGLQTLDPESLLHGTVNRIRRNLELQEILAAAVVEIRSFLATDRVMVYRFDHDQSGEVIAESIYQERLPSLLGLHFPADDIPPLAREMFLKARQRSIVDVASRKIGLSPLDCLDNSELSNDNIQYRPLDPCHIEYLKAMGVQSSFVLPLVYNEVTDVSSQPQLWGLLVSHHSQPRTILKRELRVLQQIVDQLSIAIAQSSLFAQVRAEKKRQATINSAIAQLHSFPTMQLQAALETTIEALGGCGGRIYLEAGELYTWGEQPQLPEPFQNSILEQHPFWQHWMAEFRKESVWAISDLYKEPQLRVLTTAFKATHIRGVLVMPLGYHNNLLGVISIFRKEYDTKVLWAGQRERNSLQQLPQISFETWCEERKGQAPEWQAEDISLAQTLCYHFSMTIQQQQMYQQVQGLNLNLKQQVKEQTAELEKSLLITNAVKLVSEQIRGTLDLKITLQAVVAEVRKLLNADRILIYQLCDSMDGEVVVEEISGSWKSVLSMKAPSDCFPDEYGKLYFRGRVRAIDNVATASLSPCHREFLESLQIQANLIVPINISEKLWGLLIVHQCVSPRKWQDDEIEILLSLADQAAIAIQQAQLYEQSRTAENIAKAKAMQLGQALYDLQITQTQLIQSEKMSSLGQLVAGVAHEINNPVNFIYGNLSHTIDYTQKLIQLLSIYQIQYPEPNCEIDTKAEEIDLEFITIDLPKIMSSMQVGAERICSIVLSLRNFSRLDEADMKPVDLHEGINNTLLILQHRLKSHVNCPGIQIIKEYDDLPLVECYAGQMNQVFMHIFNNAIDALVDKAKHNSLETPKIVISTEKTLKNSTVIIRIADNGSGMSQEIKTLIFDPFFTTKEVGKGTGLGLAISYQIIVEKHGGAIKCISKEDKGTEFVIEIPLRQKLGSRE